MGSQRNFHYDMPVEQHLIDMLSISPTGKIKRPPNAFMLFASVYRKNLAIHNPGITNKDVSILLGNLWNDAPEEIKSEYRRKAKLMEDKHKKLYPGYSYSPKEARLKKKAQKRIKHAAKSKAFENVTTNTEPVRIPEEDNTVGRSRIPTPSSSYVPNDPNYLIQPSPELNVCENKEEKSSLDCLSQIPPTHTNSRNDVAQQRQNETESFACKIRPCSRQEDPSHLPPDVQYSYPAYPACFSPREHNPGWRNPFYYRPIKNAPPLCYPYWSTAQGIGHPYCHRGRDGRYNDTKEFISTAPYPLNFYRLPVEQFNGINFPCYKDSGFVRYPEFNTDTTRSQASEYDFRIINPESGECFSKSADKSRLSYPFQKNYSSKDQLSAQNTVIIEPSAQTTRYLSNFIPSEFENAISSGSSYISLASAVKRNDHENICYDKSIAGEHVIHSSHQNLSSSEVGAQTDSSCSRESGSTAHFYLPNKEFSRMQSSVSEPRQRYFENHSSVLSPDSQMLGINNQSTTISFQRPYNIESRNETITSGLRQAKATNTKNHEEQYSLETDLQSERTFNYCVSYPVTSEASND